jgi:hypothetical protein
MKLLGRAPLSVTILVLFISFVLILTRLLVLIVLAALTNLLAGRLTLVLLSRLSTLFVLTHLLVALLVFLTHIFCHN